MSSSSARRPRLRLVQTDPVEAVDWTWFCGRCASRPSPGTVPAPSARVCRSCGLGVLLETRSDAVPAKGNAFVIADSALRVQAMSAPAERLLAMDEGLAVNRAIGDLLVQADVELARTSSFADLVVAALSGEPPISANVRPWNTFGVRLHARIARCGPPPAALIVLD
jgi:hypothetical protein